MLFMRLFKILFIMLLMPFSLFSQTPDEINGEVGLFKLEGDRFFSLPTKRPAKMDDGDSFQLYFKSLSSTYVYIIYESAGEDVYVLNSSFMNAEETLFLPSEDELYTLEPPKGIEKIHIVLSLDKEEKLEELISLYETDSTLKTDILTEIVRLRKSESKIALNPEKPAPMGGVYRSVTKGDQELDTTTINAGRLYVKTIRIKH